MSGWTEDEMSRIGEAEEIELASRRPDGTLRRYVTMWVARAGNNLYVRAAYGPDSRWYRHARASGTGRIRAVGVEADVKFATADPTVHAAIDDAYHSKYDRYGPRIVGSVTGTAAHAVTVRLVADQAGSR
ncbi:MAG: DUF2255 family protein [Propionibacteriaceae bacterium]|nr:DUF2255 family protein [Propionibacteriaceae bacterium]